MTAVINGIVLLALIGGFYLIVGWFWEIGVQEMVVYTEHFLLQEARKVRIQKLPEVTSTKLWDKLELMLFYSGIRNRYPFFSGKVWLVLTVLINGCVFIATSLLIGSMAYAIAVCAAICVLMITVLAWMRSRNLRNTEKYLLELVNLAESFAVTGDEPVAILMNCSSYVRGPVGQVLRNMEKIRQQGISSRMLLEQMKVMLEHPKWQEFIHNLNVCSMYNSDFHTVFDSSRKSIQGYLTSKKERLRVKQVARLEMMMIAAFGFLILLLIGQMLEMPVTELAWGNSVSRGCTVYMAGILTLFFRKLNRFEKE